MIEACVGQQLSGVLRKVVRAEDGVALYGFIRVPESADYFVYRREVQPKHGFEVGASVEFEVGKVPVRGRAGEAVKVRISKFAREKARVA